MTLSDWLTVVSLTFVVYAVGKHGFDVWIAPRLAPKGGDEGESVKKKPRSAAFRKRSQRSDVQNAVNAGSGHQDATAPTVNVQNVQVAPSAQTVPPGDAGQPSDGFTLSSGELVQLADALHRRREGATVEEAVSRAFSVTKGGSEGWKRAKALFDAATALPGSAPVGTYSAPAAPKRRSAHR
jgi:hypothetical protein